MRRNSSEEKKSKRWQPTESSRICSVHFSEDCFTQDLKALRSLNWPIKRLTLKPDAVPSIFDFSQQSASGSSKRKRTEEAIHKHHRTPEKKERAAYEKRRRREEVAEILDTDAKKHQAKDTDKKKGKINQKGDGCETESAAQFTPDTSGNSPDSTPVEVQTLPILVDTELQPTSKQAIATTMTEKDAKRKLKTPTRRHAKCQTDIQTTRISKRVQTDFSAVLPKTKEQGIQCQLDRYPLVTCHAKQPQHEAYGEMDDEEVVNVPEPVDPDWTCAQAMEDSDEEISDSQSNKGFPDKVKETGISVIDQKKIIVFEDNLMELFKFCKVCLAHCNSKMKTINGTLIVVESVCVNGHSRTWSSQPLSGKMPWGNLLCSASILFSGSSPAKAISFLRHMGVLTMSKRTYHRIQEAYLVPVVSGVWKSQQQHLFNSVCGTEKLVLGGDGRCDSPGHNAKYGCYSLMDLHSKKVLEVQLVQCNEVKNSNAMELEGLKRGLANLKQNGIKASTLVTDRHLSIRKHMREHEKETDHRVDVWHTSKGTEKKIVAAGKKKGCEDLKKWAHSISNHMYWCAASSSGDGETMVQKWLSIMNHVKDVHEGHGQLFPKCEHGPLDDEPDRKWLKEGTKAYKSLEKVINSKFLLKDIRRLSPAEQTSLLEVMHKIMCYFAPKHTHFFFEAMQARLLIAVLHFNENCDNAVKKIKHGANSGQEQWQVSYPKHKQGEPVAKQVKEPHTFDYVDTLLCTVVERRNKFPSYAKALHEKKSSGAVIPQPITQKFAKIDKQTVVTSRKTRFNKSS